MRIELVKQLENRYCNDESFEKEVTEIFEKILPVSKEFESGGFERAVKYCKDNYKDNWFQAYNYFYWQVWIDVQPDLKWIFNKVSFEKEKKLIFTEII